MAGMDKTRKAPPEVNTEAKFVERDPESGLAKAKPAKDAGDGRQPYDFSQGTDKPAPAEEDWIRERAYEIWLAEGRPLGRDLEHWMQAQDEFRQRFDWTSLKEPNRAKLR